MLHHRLDRAGDEGGPAGLVAGAEAVAVVAVEILVEPEVVAEVGVVLQLLVVAETGAAAKKQAILVVEDSDEDFDTIRDAAGRAGVSHALVRAHTGYEGLRLLQSAAGNRHALPLLILLDLNTPGDDGRAVLRDMRSEAELTTLPIIVLSASDNPRDLTFCYANGANAYHVKPVHHAKHLQMLQQVFTYWLACVVLAA